MSNEEKELEQTEDVSLPDVAPQKKHIRFKQLSDDKPQFKRRGSLTRTRSIPASLFLEGKPYKSGELTIINPQASFYGKQRQLLFKLTANCFYGVKSDATTSSVEVEIPLNQIKTIVWLKDNQNEHTFQIELATTKQWRFITPSKVDLAQWIVAIDGLLSNISLNSFTTNLVPVTDKKVLLSILHKDQYKGGTIKLNKQSAEVEEWQYESNGTVTCTMLGDETDNDALSLRYHWDGEHFQPADESPSFGAGQYSGVFLGWYLDEWMLFKTGKREKFLKYFYDQNEREYRPELTQLTAWKWTRHFLASKFNEGEWIVEGDVPEPVVMFLQMIRYTRVGYKEISELTAAVASNEQMTEETIVPVHQQQQQSIENHLSSKQQFSDHAMDYVWTAVGIVTVSIVALAMYKALILNKK